MNTLILYRALAVGTAVTASKATPINALPELVAVNAWPAPATPVTAWVKYSGELWKIVAAILPEAATTPSVSQKAYKKSWARLIKQVWEVDPLECPLCGSEMRVISIINDDAVVEKILRHVGEWEENTDTRGSPVSIMTEPEECIDQKDEIVSIPFYESTLAELRALWSSPISKCPARVTILAEKTLYMKKRLFIPHSWSG